MITAEHIKAARSAAKESQAAFGGRLGVDQSTIHRWETDGPPARPIVQSALAAVVLPLLDQHPTPQVPALEAAQ